MARLATAWRARRGGAWWGKDRHGKDSFELVVVSANRQGAAWRGWAGFGSARQGKVKATEKTQPPFFVHKSDFRKIDS